MLRKFTNSASKLSLAAAAFAFAGAATFSPQASACGGLFCNNATPVNQVAERIVFSVNDDETVTAVIEILYEGPAESFAWVLPVPEGEVSVGVSSTSALDSIDQQSNPLYQLNNRMDDESCNDDRSGLFGFAAGGVATNAEAAQADTPEEASSVTVLNSGSAGPYDWEQIMVDVAGDDPADVALEWLTSNGYEVTDDTAALLAPYLEQDHNLVAFRLSKSDSAGSVRPILITYPGTQPSVPIRPTAVAANEDMGIKVWVLGDSRAVPLNYLNLELNEAAINWFNAGQNYNDVVIAAANEAGGHGFVTEHSGPAAAFAPNIYPTWVEQNWEDINRTRFDSARDFFQRVFSSFSGLDGVADVMADPDLVPLREGATPEQFLNCVDCYFQVNVPVRNNAYPETPYVAGEDPLDNFDATEFLEAFETLVIKPLRDTQALFDTSASSTRFYTTLSPDEMTEDPLFDFNDELGDVDNTHQADQVTFCRDDGDEWSITLPQGTTVSGQGRVWPLSTQEMDAVPQNFRILSMSTSGEGEVMVTNADAIQSALDDLGSGESARDLDDRINGCAVSHNSNSSAHWGLFAGLGLLLLRRRSDRTRS